MTEQLIMPPHTELNYYHIWAENEVGDDMSLIVTASNPEQALELWREYYPRLDWGNYDKDAGVAVWQLPQATTPQAFIWREDGPAWILARDGSLGEMLKQQLKD